MSQVITEQQVRHVAKLSRLKLTDPQIQQFTKQLSSILDYVTKLGELDTTNVEPTAHAAPLKNVLREDRSVPGMGVENVLLNAPDHDGPFFKVPKVLEE